MPSKTETETSFPLNILLKGLQNFLQHTEWVGNVSMTKIWKDMSVRQNTHKNLFKHSQVQTKWIEWLGVDN
jgi:hypothetical protein